MNDNRLYFRPSKLGKIIYHKFIYSFYTFFRQIISTETTKNIYHFERFEYFYRRAKRN